MDTDLQEKIRFEGVIRAVQPRSTVWRYRMERTHRLTGYNLFLNGTAAENEGQFSVAMSETQFHKLRFHIGDVIRGTAWTKRYPDQEYADYYRAGGLQKTAAAPVPDSRTREPWTGECPGLEVYQERGCRMLDSRCWKGKYFACRWACMASVTIEYYWGVIQKHRFESFCYGPFSCSLHRMGRPRAVPYRGDGSYYDDGDLDVRYTKNRQMDEDEED